MASLTPKVIKGKTYYYARECQRIDGKPKITKTIYLGTLDNMIAAVQGATAVPTPQSVDIAAFGDVVALYDIAEEIDLVSLMDDVVPKRRKTGLTIGQYMLLAAMNRAVCPTKAMSPRRRCSRPSPRSCDSVTWHCPKTASISRWCSAKATTRPKRWRHSTRATSILSARRCQSIRWSCWKSRYNDLSRWRA